MSILARMKSGKKSANTRRSGKARPGTFRTGTVFLLLACITVMLAAIIIMLPGKNTQVRDNGTKEDITWTGDGTGNGWTTTPDSGHGNAAGNTATVNDGSVEISLTGIVKKPGRIAIVIDDAGNDANSLLPFLKFPGKITIAVLPQLPHSARNATLAHEAGKEVLLHLPMEPSVPAKTGPGAILVTMDKKTIAEVFFADLASVPFVSGVNNHMGSLAMTDQQVLESLFELLKEKKLYFLDSRTTAGTLGGKYASIFQVPFLQRKIFLDDLPDRENILKSLSDGVDYARLVGSAVLIGHVQNQEVIRVLMEKYDELVASGIQFVFARDLLVSGGNTP